jgi:hypothetical protein
MFRKRCIPWYRELLTVTSGYGPWCIFYTDGSLIGGCAGFDVHQIGVGGFGYNIRVRLVFSLFNDTLLRSPERCLILTDSLSTIKAKLSRKIAQQTHLLLYECKELCWSLCQNGIEVKFMWIPSHVGLMGNELVDDRARQAALEGTIFDRPLSFQRAIFRVWLDRH